MRASPAFLSVTGDRNAVNGQRLMLLGRARIESRMLRHAERGEGGPCS